MHLLTIILAALLSVAITGPVGGGVKERVFGVANTGSPFSPGIKERVFNVASTRTTKILDIIEHLRISELSARNSVIEGVLWGLIDDLRNLIVNGSDDVPVLDPFTLNELHLDDDLLDLPNSHVALKDVEVLNLSSFVVDQLSVSMVSVILQRYRINLDARIPVLDTQAGNYDISLQVFGGHIFGNGKMKLKIINPRIHGFLVVGLRLSINGVFLTIHDCQLHFSLEAFEAQITGMFENEVASDFVSSVLNSLIPDLVEFFEEDISKTLSSTVQEIANDILKDLNVGSLFP